MSPLVFLIQGIYYIVTGLWALADIAGFQAVTGPKTDLWLVKTVGVLVTVIGAALLRAGFRKEPLLEVKILSVGTALGLMAIEIFYAARNEISKIYLLDALIELAFAVLALTVTRRKPPAEIQVKA